MIANSGRDHSIGIESHLPADPNEVARETNIYKETTLEGRLLIEEVVAALNTAVPPE